MKRGLGGLVVGLPGGQFIGKLFASVELADLDEVNFGELALYLGCSLSGIV